MRKKLPRQDLSYGATLVEFSIIATFLISFTGTLLDFGLFLWDYSTLTHKVASVAQDSAGKESSCNQILDSAKYELSQTKVRGTLDVSKTELNSAPDILGGETLPVLEVVANWNVNCFICLMLPVQISIPISSQAILEGKYNGCT